MELFRPEAMNLTKYLFFTGKGGVGKTSAACATAVTLADEGKKVLLISTDPASNLQDVFHTELTNKGTPIEEVPNLMVANLDPIEAAAEYRESVISPYRGKLPDAVLTNMEEQLSGSCTVEIAAFNEFSNFITDQKAQTDFDYIIFDTAPTGHTLRMLQLPSAWSNFISENTHGASCLGQLSGLESRKEIYKEAVATLADGKLTTLILVARPEISPLKEAERAAKELSEIGVNNQILIINGVLTSYDDGISKSMYQKQRKTLYDIPEGLKKIPIYAIPLRAYNITGIKNVRALLTKNQCVVSDEKINAQTIHRLRDVVEDLYHENKKVIFTMGKGGVGKTTVAAAIAMGLAAKGKKVHLTTTDPAAHLKFVIDESSGITMSHIDEHAELKKYQEEVLAKARETMSEDDIAYIEEDLRSPCTQEIAVFRAFAEIVEKAEDQIV
ncbi:MAG TPA: arsenical pump-driving ATPase, partial [Oscillospiraceae bacterium]|nr:arsenical pump-driving ATPase [Oscillospiraceae bacterium]